MVNGRIGCVSTILLLWIGWKAVPFSMRSVTDEKELAMEIQKGVLGRGNSQVKYWQAQVPIPLIRLSPG